MALTRIPTKGIADNAVSECKVAPGAVTNAKIGPGAVTAPNVGPNAIVTGNITDGTIVNADISPSAAIASGKLTVDTSILQNNISLLGFKMAVNEGLTVFNLVDGVVDEFHDESGTDEAEGTNDTYDATCDFYQNATADLSAGFTMTSVTEPDTSTAGNNPAYGTAAVAEYTVPACTTSITASVWGAGGGGGDHCGSGSTDEVVGGGGGGFTTGNLTVTPGQKFEILAGEGGAGDESPVNKTITAYGGGRNQSPHSAGSASAGSGGGLSGIFAEGIALNNGECNPTGKAPQIYMIAGSGGGGGGHHPNGTQPAFFNSTYWNGSTAYGGSGGGLTGLAGGSDRAQTSGFVKGGTGGPSGSPTAIPSNVGHFNGGGGDQEQGGQGAPSTAGGAEPGGFLYGGPFTGPDNNIGAGGAGYYGGGAGGYTPIPTCSGARMGGGGSSYYGHPAVSSASTEAGNDEGEGGGVGNPNYPLAGSTNEGHGAEGSTPVQGLAEDGFVLITGAGAVTSTTIVSNAFTANSVPTTSRIVVFEEDVGTPTLNTHIIASISRDGGSNYTTATLADSGYVTGSSGQRILTGSATISGQPSGQSMRWKLALSSQKVKIHGVSLQWA